jgi:HD-GYP domain-containing protein (c-di-GMP phosphodiesterase class II)
MESIHTEVISRFIENIAKIINYNPSKALIDLKRIVQFIDDRIPYRDGHNKRVAELAVRLGKEIGLPEDGLFILEIASLLHDLGKAYIKEEILEKPGILTNVERKEIEKHVVNAAIFLSCFREFKKPLEGILSHHEHYDGSGYPKGIAGKEIPLNGRIIAIADAYDAMTSKRPYRKSKTKEEAIEELKRNSKKQFDPHLVDISVKILLYNAFPK